MFCINTVGLNCGSLKFPQNNTYARAEKALQRTGYCFRFHIIVFILWAIWQT